MIKIAGMGLLCALLVFTGYQWGRANQKAIQAIAVTQIQDRAAKELNRKTEALNDISYRYHQTTAKQQTRIGQLQKQLRSRPAVTQCVDGPNGGFVAFIDNGHIRMLDAATRGKSELSADDRSGFDGKTGAVTVDKLIQYTAYTIGEYNQCAGQLNALIDQVKTVLPSKQSTGQ